MLKGGTGLDTADYAGSAVGVTASLAIGTGVSGDGQGDTFLGIENLAGSDQNDSLDRQCLGQCAARARRP